MNCDSGYWWFTSRDRNSTYLNFDLQVFNTFLIILICLLPAGKTRDEIFTKEKLLVVYSNTGLLRKRSQKPRFPTKGKKSSIINITLINDNLFVRAYLSDLPKLKDNLYNLLTCNSKLRRLWHRFPRNKNVFTPINDINHWHSVFLCKCNAYRFVVIRGPVSKITVF